MSVTRTPLTVRSIFSTDVARSGNLATTGRLETCPKAARARRELIERCLALVIEHPRRERPAIGPARPAARAIRALTAAAPPEGSRSLWIEANSRRMGAQGAPELRAVDRGQSNDHTATWDQEQILEETARGERLWRRLRLEGCRLRLCGNSDAGDSGLRGWQSPRRGDCARGNE